MGGGSRGEDALGPTCLLSKVSRLCETKSWNAKLWQCSCLPRTPSIRWPVLKSPAVLAGIFPTIRLLFHLSSLLNLVACPDSPARGVYNGVSLNAQLLCTNPPKSSKPSGCTFSMPFPIRFSIPSQALPLTDATPSGNPLNQPRFSHHFPPPTSSLILDSTARELWQ